MKKIFYISIFGSLTLMGQEEKLSPLENAIVLDEVAFQKGKDRLVVQRIEEPDLKVEEEHVSDPLPVVGDAFPTQTFLVSATTYADQGTYLEVWPTALGKKAAIQGWSNIDWSVFQTFHKFVVGQKGYQIMLFHTKLSEEEISRRSNDIEQFYPKVPELLPDLESGARYLITSQAETEQADTLDFLEFIHMLFEENSQELKTELIGILEANEERKRQIQIESEKPKKRVLKIWRRSLENK